MGSEDDLGSEGFEAGQEICIADSVEFDGRTRVDVDKFGSADDLCAMAANRFQVGQMPVLVHGQIPQARNRNEYSFAERIATRRRMACPWLATWLPRPRQPTRVRTEFAVTVSQVLSV